jgi:Sec-independent protein translocase protein TatA
VSLIHKTFAFQSDSTRSMEIFNIGHGELIFIVLLMIVLLGPLEMIQLARRTGEMIRKINQSALWKDLRKFEKEARELPVQLAREAGFEEQMAEIRRSTRIRMDLDRSPKKEAGEVRSPAAGGRLRRPQPSGAGLYRTNDASGEKSETEPVETPPAE